MLNISTSIQYPILNLVSIEKKALFFKFDTSAHFDTLIIGYLVHINGGSSRHKSQIKIEAFMKRKIALFCISFILLSLTCSTSLFGCKFDNNIVAILSLNHPTFLKISKNQRYIAVEEINTALQTSDVQVYDLHTPQKEAIFTNPIKDICYGQFAFANNDTCLVVFFYKARVLNEGILTIEGILAIYDLQKKACIAEIPCEGVYKAGRLQTKFLPIKHLVVKYIPENIWKTALKIYNLEIEPFAQKPFIIENISSYHLSKNQKYLAVVTKERIGKKICSVYNLNTKQKIFTKTLYDCRKVELSNNGTYLAIRESVKEKGKSYSNFCTVDHNTLTVYEVQSNDRVFRKALDNLFKFKFSKNERYMILSEDKDGENYTLSLYDLEKKDEKNKLFRYRYRAPNHIFYELIRNLEKFELSPDGVYLGIQVATKKGDSCIVYNTKTKQEIFHQEKANFLGFSNDGSRLIVKNSKDTDRTEVATWLFTKFSHIQVYNLKNYALKKKAAKIFEKKVPLGLATKMHSHFDTKKLIISVEDKENSAIQLFEIPTPEQENQQNNLLKLAKAKAYWDTKIICE